MASRGCLRISYLSAAQWPRCLVLRQYDQGTGSAQQWSRRCRIRVAAAEPEGDGGTAARVEDVLDIEVPLADLPTQAEEWEQAVTEMTTEDEEIAELPGRRLHGR